MHNTVSDTQQRGDRVAPVKGAAADGSCRWTPASTPADAAVATRVSRVDSRRGARHSVTQGAYSMRHEQRIPRFGPKGAGVGRALRGRRVARPGGRAVDREIRCPADGSLVTTVSEGSGRHRGGDRRRATGIRRRPLAPHPRTRAGPAAGPHGRPHRPRPKRRSPAPSRSTPASAWSRPSTTSTTSWPASATTAGVAGTDAGRVIDTGRADAISRVVLRAGRRVRPDHAVELPAAADVVEGRAGSAGRQHVRAQAERADAVDGHPADEGARGGRAAGRRRQPRARRRARGRRAAVRGPGRRPGLVHRRPRDRPADHGHGRRRR